MAKTQIGYVFKSDIVRHLFGETLDELTGGKKAIGTTPAVTGDDTVWQNLRPPTIEKVKGYLRHWYDADAETAEFYVYDIAEAFILGERVAGDADGTNKYLCIQDAPAGTALTDTDFFTLTDDRNPVILECVVIMIIYNLSRRYNPRQIPEQRQIDFDTTMELLRDIQKGRVDLDIKKRTFEDEESEETDAGQRIAFGNFDDQTNDVY